MFETAMAVTVLFWGLIVLVLAVGILVANVKLFWYLIERNKLAKAHVMMVKQKTELKYNKIATMDPSELDDYLIKLFSMQIQITTDADISENDPNAEGKLYFKTAERIIRYLGPETVEAIEFYYGANYIVRWCEMHYMYLNKNNRLLDLIKTKNSSADTIADDLKTK